MFCFLQKQHQRKKERILHDDFDIEMTQNLEREVSLMCNLSQDVVDRTLLSAIQHLMETLNLTAEQAMAALKIPEQSAQIQSLG